MVVDRLASMRVLFVGDVVGKPGRAGLAATMPDLRDRHSPQLVIANGENSAGGIGITERTANELFEIGVDVITTGNHVYRHREAYEFLDRSERVVRPANYPAGNPGRGSTIVEAGGRRVAGLNLSGAVQLQVARSPFAEGGAQLARLEGNADAGMQGGHRRAEKPGDVEIEPVLGGQLDGDQHRRRERRHLTQGAAAGNEGDEDDEGDGEGLDGRLEPFERWVLAPDAERGVAVDLAPDGAVIEGGEAGIHRGQREHDGDRGEEGGEEQARGAQLRRGDL